MSELNLWHLFHDYQNLVARGLVQPLSCPDTGDTYTLKIGYEDLPVLWCPTCDTVVVPGLSIISQVQAVVKEHHV